MQDGRLFGRGSTDMKGGLAAILIAMKALKEADADLSGNVALVCTVDEEDLGIGIRGYTAAALKDPGFSYSACVVAEPTDLETVIGCRGDSFIELEIIGKSAHAGRPKDGRNAIDAAVSILELIREDHARLEIEQDPLLGAGTWNAGLIHGGTGTSMVADKCTISLDRRFMPDEDPELVLGELQNRINEAGIDQDGISVEAKVTMKLPGFRTPSTHPLVANSVSALAEAGISSSITGWTASCDGGFIATDLGVPSIVMGPGGVNDQAHQSGRVRRRCGARRSCQAYVVMCLRHRGWTRSEFDSR